MSVRVAINGFGRIGRNVLRAIVEAGRSDITVVAVNDLAPPETNAHLLRFDSVHGRFPGEVSVRGDILDCGIGPIKVTAIKDPALLPWRALAVDIALECTGLFTTKEKASAHLKAGAKWADTPRALAAQCELTFTSLPGPSEVDRGPRAMGEPSDSARPLSRGGGDPRAGTGKHRTGTNAGPTESGKGA